GSVGHTNWFYSIGSQVAWSGGLPAYSAASSRVALWVRPDDSVAGGTPVVGCMAPPNYVSVGGDCNDDDGAVAPGAEELCNDLDDDCDGELDEGCPFGDIELIGAPKPLQFYARDLTTNQCVIPVSGEFVGDAETVRLLVHRDGEPYAEVTGSGQSSFELEVPIEAGLHRYHLEVFWDGDSGFWKSVSTHPDILCGDVYLIDGQSNAVALDYQNEGLGDLNKTPFIRSFGSSVNNANVVNDIGFGVAGANKGNTHAAIGQWGLQLAHEVMTAQELPLLVINGAVGGTKVAQHQRNAANPTDPSTIYGRLLWRVQQAEVADAVRGIFWHQGESDGGMAFDTYLGLWTAMYEGWLTDYPDVEAVYTFQVRAGCGSPTWNRNVHRELPTLLDKVIGNMSTTGVAGHDNCHFFNSAYMEWGTRMARLVNRDLYGVDVPGNIEAPNPVGAYWLDETHLAINFGDTGGGLLLQPGAAAYFSLSGGVGVEGATVAGSTVVLETAAASAATWVSFVDVPGDIPWLINDLGIGAFAVYQLPIGPAP
ncbi:MAG: hypothetical protein ACI9OJ_003796, partial [Myxococcota bacterium]